MGTRSLAQRLLSPAGFLAVGLFFLLPFVTVSCTGHSDAVADVYTGDAAYSGKALVAGDRAALSLSDEYAEEGRKSGEPPPDPKNLEAIEQYLTPIDRQPFLWMALGLAIAGIVATAWPRSWYRALWGVALAGVCAVFLIGGEVLALRAAADRVNADAEPYFGAPHAGVTDVDAEPVLSAPTVGVAHIAYGFWLALASLVVLLAAHLVDLVRQSRRPPA